METRRFQFRISTIFWLMFVVAAFFGGIAVQRRETEEVRQQLEAVTNAFAERERQLSRGMIHQLPLLMELQNEPQRPNSEGNPND